MQININERKHKKMLYISIDRKRIKWTKEKKKKRE